MFSVFIYLDELYVQRGECLNQGVDLWSDPSFSLHFKQFRGELTTLNVWYRDKLSGQYSARLSTVNLLSEITVEYSICTAV